MCSPEKDGGCAHQRKMVDVFTRERWWMCSPEKDIEAAIVTLALVIRLEFRFQKASDEMAQTSAAFKAESQS